MIVPPPRPTIRKGDYGYNVKEVQTALRQVVDGIFGPMTDIAVKNYQGRHKLVADGIVGPATWPLLEAQFTLAPYPPPLPVALSAETVKVITEMAVNHAAADIDWRGRGKAPNGYVKGMALAYAHAYLRLKAKDFLVFEASKANTHDADYDVFAWYADEFSDMGWSNEKPGVNTLRHLYVFLMGLGMRESSGEHCTGRDQSADNVSAETCEAGLYQTSWNAQTCCTDIGNLFDQYSLATNEGGETPSDYLEIWAEEVECSASDWASYGSGDGFMFQELCKSAPTFAVETAAIVLRGLRQHYGPVNRKEVELKREVNEMLMEVEKIVEALGVW
jgi:hypothetical protein